MGDSPAYIAFEGPEGTGKSTQAKLLAEALGAVLTRETGGTAIGQRLRDILHDNAVDPLEWRAEALITAADRAQHIAEVVLPALRSGRPVVSDRSVYSTLAYQGYGRGLDLDELRNDQRLGDPGRVADAGRLRRGARRHDRRSAQPAASSTASSGRATSSTQRVLDGFGSMADADPERWVTISAEGTKDATAAQILAAVRDRLAVGGGAAGA